jgi:C-terminal topoisomerase domain
VGLASVLGCLVCGVTLMAVCSKINYLDPRCVWASVYDIFDADGVTGCRITAAWCKTHNVPIEKIFSKTLLVKCACGCEYPRR